MPGTTSVDFAGTEKEAREFTHTKASQFPNKLALGRSPRGERSPNGDCMIFATWKNREEREHVRESFEANGWDAEFQGVRIYGPKEEPS